MKNYLDLIKSINILLVVVGHIFVLYNGKNFGLEENNTLLAVNKGFMIFRMPLYVALSGAIFRLCVQRGKYKEFIPFLRNKTKRILLPFVVVATFFLAPTLYFLGLSHYDLWSTLFKTLCCLEAMDRHLWFLPGLFWIFFAVWWLTHLKINIYFSFALSVILSMIWSEFLPGFDFFRITHAVHFMPYFIFGMWIATNDRLVGIRMSLLSAFVGIVVALLMRINPIQVFDVGLLRILACSGIAFMMSIGKWVFSKFEKIPLLPYFLDNSYPIYLFHVMVIYGMYYMLGSSMPIFIMIPLTFAVSISFSIFIAWCFRKLRVQVLIGEK